VLTEEEKMAQAKKFEEDMIEAMIEKSKTAK